MPATLPAPPLAFDLTRQIDDCPDDAALTVLLPSIQAQFGMLERSSILALIIASIERARTLATLDGPVRALVCAATPRLKSNQQKSVADAVAERRRELVKQHLWGDNPGRAA